MICRTPFGNTSEQQMTTENNGRIDICPQPRSTSHSFAKHSPKTLITFADFCPLRSASLGLTSTLNLNPEAPSLDSHDSTISPSSTRFNVLPESV